MNYLSKEEKHEIDIVSRVIPFKTNNYVIDYLIDWEKYDSDPIYTLNFPKKEMLTEDQYEKVNRAIKKGTDREVKQVIHSIRMEMNPHPAQQMTNVPVLDGEELKGAQHKYRDILLFFPSQGQTCHAHCTFCFRWPQFIKDMDLKFSMNEISKIVEYIRRNEHINEILFTGGDPMVMSPAELSKYIDVLLNAGLDHLKNIRFGTKSISYWPFTYLPEFSDEAEDMLNLFKRITDRGFHLSIMAHFNHPNELENEIVQKAIRNIRQTGAVIRTQSPIIKHINNNSDDWARMWKTQVKLGMIPYYMFVERETGPFDYFSVPLIEVYRIFESAIKKSGSFAKTVTGPVMSADKGKVQILGIIKNPADGKRYFVLQYVRHRDHRMTFAPFLMHYNPDATWVDQLVDIDSKVAVN
jgi:L-lysine 2,3-aminomutase